MMMNKRFLSLLCLLTFTPILLSITTAGGVAFSGSYMERATGIEALYLNPANIHKKTFGAEYMFLSLSSGINNNAFYADLILGEKGRLLSEKEKSDILDRMYKSAVASGHAHLILAGFSVDKWAVSTGINAFGYGRLDKDYLKIALQGNEYGKFYDFSANTGAAGMLYQDVTVGYGGETINKWFPEKMDNWPDIQVGISASYLIGATMYKIDEFLSEARAELLYRETNNMRQQVVLRNSDKGSGFKMNIGLASEVYSWDDDHYITTGMSFDNIFGFMKWHKHDYTGYNLDLEMTFEKDDNGEYVYNDNTGDYYNEDDDELNIHPDEWSDTNTRTENFPITYRLGGKYVYKKMSASLDLEQNLWKHPAYSYSPEISLGFEYIFGNKWPVQLGYRVPFRDFLAAYSIGGGVRTSSFELGLAFSVVDSFNYRHMKGFSFGTYTKFSYDW